MWEFSLVSRYSSFDDHNNKHDDNNGDDIDDDDVRNDDCSSNKITVWVAVDTQM
jgi:hypothetical protein